MTTNDDLKNVGRKARTGRLLYIKPSYFGELPVDVRSYAEISKTFPHESTADQFFSNVSSQAATVQT